MKKTLRSRRDFVKASALAGVGLSLNLALPSCMTEVSSPYLSNIGIQLWTLRDQLKENPEATLKAVKEAGYKQVELARLAGYPDLSPIIKDLDLKVNSSHFNWAYITQRWDLQGQTPENTSFDYLLENADKAGLDSLIFAYWLPEERSSLDDYKKLADQLNQAGEKANKAGIQMGYHNHNFEFAPMEGSTGYDTLLERTEAELVKFELDVFWSSVAGIPTLPLMEKMKGKLHWLHLKDKLAGTPKAFDTGEVSHEAFQPLGKGEVDLRAVIKAAPELGVKYCMVEQDHSPSIFKDINTSMEYLKNPSKG